MPSTLQLKKTDLLVAAVVFALLLFTAFNRGQIQANARCIGELQHLTAFIERLDPD